MMVLFEEALRLMFCVMIMYAIYNLGYKNGAEEKELSDIN